MKKIQKIIGKIVNVLIVLVIIAIIVCAYSVFSLKVLHNKYVNFFGYSVFEVATGSMEDAISVGDAVLVKINEDYKVGDVVTYQNGGDFITHRVVSIDDNYVITKGDANNVNDNPVEQNMILGKVVKIMPRVGIWKKVVLTPKVITLVLLTLFVFSILFSYEGNAIKIISSKKAQKEMDQRIEEEVNKEVNKKVAVINRRNKRKVLEATQILNVDEIKKARKEKKLEKTQALNLKEINKEKDKVEVIGETQILNLDDIKKEADKVNVVEKTQVLNLDDIKKESDKIEVIGETQILNLDDIKKEADKIEIIGATQILNLDEINNVDNKEMVEATQVLDISNIKKE